MSKILVLNGNPKGKSFCGALADAYGRAALEAGHDVRLLDLSALPVSLVLPDYADKSAPPAGWVAEVQQAIEWSEHWVIVSPMWWGSPPAALKALLDLVLMPGFAFRYRKGGGLWDKLLKGRSARVILTMDSPGWYFKWVLGSPMARQFKTQILEFCGFNPVHVTSFGPIKASTDRQRERWLAEVDHMGAVGQ